MKKKPTKVFKKIADVLEERKVDDRRTKSGPAYINPSLDRRKGEERRKPNTA